MKIVVTRSGGFGGLTRTWSLEVSRTEAEQRWLPLAEAEADVESRANAEVEPEVESEVESEAHTTKAALEARVATADDAAQVAAGSGSVERDRFSYRIAIGYTEVHFPESELGDPWRELIDRARAATSARQKAPSMPPASTPSVSPDERRTPSAGPGPSPELL